MRNPQDIINRLTHEETENMMTCCMINLSDEVVVEVIMRKVHESDMFADELESAIQNYAADLQGED
jgi:hypothetical protein